MYVIVTKPSTASKDNVNGEGETGGDDEDHTADKSIVKFTKAEKRAKLKKSRKEAKKQGKELDKSEAEQTPQAAVLVCSDWTCNFINLFF